nr:hexose kinase [Leucobacter luti]
MITVTPSPAIDWTIGVPEFSFGLVHRAAHELREPSGKGVNVSAALQRAGIPTHAILAAAGDGTEFMARELSALGVPYSFTPGGPVRTNVTLLVDGQPDTKVNTSSQALGAAERAGLADRVRALAAQGADALLTAGSLPPGTDATLHAELVALGRELGLFTAVDSSGPALVAALAAAPDLVKPNAHELAEIVGRELGTLGEVRDAARALRERHGVGCVLVSLGADGALLVDGAGELWAGARPDRVVNAVGAGDATLAGFLAARSDRRNAVRTAVRWGASAVAHPTTLFNVLPAAELDEWCTDTIDWDRPLTPDSE